MDRKHKLVIKIDLKKRRYIVCGVVAREFAVNGKYVGMMWWKSGKVPEWSKGRVLRSRAYASRVRTPPLS